MVVFDPKSVEVFLPPVLLAHGAPHHDPPGQLVLPGGLGGELLVVVGDQAGEGVPVDHDAVGRGPGLLGANLGMQGV